MARTYNRKKTVPTAGGRTFRARIVRRETVNVELLADAFVGLALARIEKEAEQQHKRANPKQRKEDCLDERSA
jgi:hypothetical protein